MKTPVVTVWRFGTRAVLAGTLFVCGCDRGSTKELDRAGQAVESWSATLDTTVDQWGEGRVPRQYVGQIMKSADKALDEQVKRLEKAPASDARRDEMHRRLSELRRRVHEVSGAVERDDRAAAVRAAATGGNP